MNDQSAQDPQQQATSYVDDYTPPTTTSQPSDSDDGVVSVPVSDTSHTDAEDVEDNMEDALEGDTDDSNTADSEEQIESQNIFSMLDVDDGDEGLKEKFLDQLQEVIWDDFLNTDVELLLTQEELSNFKVFKDKVNSTQGEEQEKAKDEMVEYLEKLIPDLEDIMLEKALDLKSDLYVERINGMKEYFAQKPDILEKISEAERLMFDDKWKSSVTVLNSIKE